jgi:zinc/manganese transport system substrate-binding protein
MPVKMRTAPYPLIRRSGAFAAAIVVFLLVTGCDKRDSDIGRPPSVDGASNPAQARKLKVVATTSIIGDWVNTIGGADVDLTTLVGPDGDPHEYEPVPSDASALARSDLIFENGLGLETWLDKLYRSSQSKAKLIVVTRGIDPRRIPTIETGSFGPATEEFDPHAWQDVRSAMVMVGNIRDALLKADPAHAAEFKARTDAYIKQLDQLDRWVQTQIDTLPKNRRNLVTSHDAFGYFGRRYGVDVTRSALESVTSEASDPSALQIAEVISQIKSTGVPVIFLENIQNPKLIDQIAADARVKVGPALYSDALGQPGTPGDTYIKMIRYNTKSIVDALSR